jgi:predicted AAA+ superfamily ATPase
MKRYLYHAIKEDLNRKIVLLTGPRQSGKTTLARMMSDNFDYFNFDNPEHRTDLLDRSWDRRKGLVIFDELHKLKTGNHGSKASMIRKEFPRRYLSREAPNWTPTRRSATPWRAAFFNTDSTRST